MARRNRGTTNRRDRRAKPNAAPDRSTVWRATRTLRRVGSNRPGQYAIVLGVALLARLAAIHALAPLPIWSTPALDSSEYLQLAAQIGSGLGWPSFAPHGPGYPAFIAALRTLTPSLTFLRVVQASLGAVSCVLAARLAGQLEPRAFLPTGLLLALYGPLVLTDVAILAEGLLILVLLIALSLVVHSGARPRRWLITGLALGIATTIRPTALVLVPAFATIALVHLGSRTALKSAAAMTTGVLLILSPLLWHNWQQSHFLNVQGWGGMNIYVGNTPTGTGLPAVRPGAAWDALEGEAFRAGDSSPQTVDTYYVHKTIDEIRSAPAAYVRLLGRKLMWFLQADEVRDTHSFYFFVEAIPPLGWLPGFGVLIALAAAGLLESPLLKRRAGAVPDAGARRLRTSWLIAYLVAIALTSVFLIVGSRYRLPVVPVLAMFAGAALVWMFDYARNRQFGPLAAAAIVVLLVFGFAHLRVDAASHNFAEEWTLTADGLMRANDLAGAEAACRRAIQLDPHSSFALDELGWVQFLQGHADLARTTLTSAVAAAPNAAHAWYHLGRIEQQSGNHDAAIAAFRRSVAVAPRLDVVEALGQELLATNALSEAQPLLQRVVDLSPENGTAHFGLTLIALGEGRPGDAVREATTTTQLLPRYGRAWLLLARAAIADGRDSAAEQALAKAEEFGSDRGEVVAGRAKVLLVRGDQKGAEALVAATAGGDTAVAATIWREVRTW